MQWLCYRLRAVVLVVSISWGISASLAFANPADDAHVSPKNAWGDFDVVEEDVGYPWWGDVLAWVPNRILDFIDIFRVDVGIGPSRGAVIRVSKYAQAGYRVMRPGSFRIGDFGRKAPILYERSNEIGVSPSFAQSKDREVCPGEIGLGGDLFILGGYAGICVEELADFFVGLFFFDIMDDDLK